MNKIIERPLNIGGSYRICEEPTCTTNISCPYTRCRKHWTAIININSTGMKELVDTGDYI